DARWAGVSIQNKNELRIVMKIIIINNENLSHCEMKMISHEGGRRLVSEDCAGRGVNKGGEMRACNASGYWFPMQGSARVYKPSAAISMCAAAANNRAALPFTESPGAMPGHKSARSLRIFSTRLIASGDWPRTSAGNPARRSLAISVKP